MVVCCMFSTNLSTLGLFLPITGALIILCNIVFGIVWLRKTRRKKRESAKNRETST